MKFGELKGDDQLHFPQRIALRTKIKKPTCGALTALRACIRYCFCSLNMQICDVFVAVAVVIRDFKIVHDGRLGRLDECHVTQNPRDI